MAEENAVLKIAAVQTWLSDYPSADEIDRARALREIWKIHQSRSEEAEGRTWARVELQIEPSEKGRGVLYTLLFRSALEADMREVAIQIGEEVWATGLTDPATLNELGWGLVGDPGWNVDLGTRLAERGIEHAEPGRDRASIMDTAGWGYYLLSRKDPSRRLLEGALAELPEIDREIAGHLVALYERIGDKDALLKLLTRILHTRMDSKMQLRAEALLVEQGGDVAEFRKGLWRERLDRAEAAPDFELKDLQGRNYRRSDYEGRVLMLNFWHPT